MNKLHITVSKELKDKLKSIAEKKQRSVNFIVSEALNRYVRNK